MSELVVVAFNGRDTADQVLNDLRSMQRDYLVDLEDAVVVTRDAEGKLNLKQSVNLVGMGAMSGGTWGALWGVLVGVLFMIAMRTKSPTLQKPIKAMNKNLSNPRALKDAGQADAQWSVSHHVGRTSGKAYETPVGMYATDDALFVVLPYGTNTDWYKNLAAAGGGTAVHKGVTYEFSTPEVIPTSDILDILPDKGHGNLKTFDIDQTLRLPVTTKSAPATRSA